MDIIHLFPLLSYFSGLLVFITVRDHFFIMLLSLEFISLSVFFNLFIMLNYQVTNLFFLIIYLTMAVCEGVLGLSVMVMCIRSMGNEYMKSFNFLW